MEPYTWRSGQWFEWRHAVPVDALPVTLPDGRTVRFGVCGLATVPRRSHWPRCPACVLRMAWGVGRTTREETVVTTELVVVEEIIKAEQEEQAPQTPVSTGPPRRRARADE